MSPWSAAYLNLSRNDEELVLVSNTLDSSMLTSLHAQLKNTLKILGLYESADPLVCDEMIRGVSGGQKRRVALGEMLLPPRRIKFLDAISNGLDAATTDDTIQSLKLITNTAGFTTVISLIQPAPDVLYV